MSCSRVRRHLHPLARCGSRRRPAAWARPAISTRHSRQAPTSVRPSRWQSVGDVDPVLARPPRGSSGRRVAGDFLAVDREGVDRRSCHGTSPWPARSCRPRPGRRCVDDVGEVLVAEVAQRAEDRVGRGLAQAAQAACAGPCSAQLLQLRQVGHAWPARRLIWSSSMHICTVPTRQGMHLPHDSSRQNSMKYRATSTMQDVSSMTIMPPEPMIEPSSMSDS